MKKRYTALLLTLGLLQSPQTFCSDGKALALGATAGVGALVSWEMYKFLSSGSGSGAKPSGSDLGRIPVVEVSNLQEKLGQLEQLVGDGELEGQLEGENLTEAINFILKKDDASSGQNDVVGQLSALKAVLGDGKLQDLEGKNLTEAINILLTKRYNTKIGQDNIFKQLNTCEATIGDGKLIQEEFEGQSLTEALKILIARNVLLSSKLQKMDKEYGFLKQEMSEIKEAVSAQVSKAEESVQSLEGTVSKHANKIVDLGRDVNDCVEVLEGLAKNAQETGQVSKNEVADLSVKAAGLKVLEDGYTVVKKTDKDVKKENVEVMSVEKAIEQGVDVHPEVLVDLFPQDVVVTSKPEIPAAAQV